MDQSEHEKWFERIESAIMALKKAPPGRTEVSPSLSRTSRPEIRRSNPSGKYDDNP